MNQPDRYAVMGHPIAHSLSPTIHARFALETHQALTYTAIDVLPEEFAAALQRFFSDGGRGLNITRPHKQTAFRLCGRLSERARQAGSVNTLALTADGEILGENTDGVAVVRDLTVNCQLPLTGQRLLLLGAGGAARGAVAPLLSRQPAELVIANRTAARAIELAGEYAGLGQVRGTAMNDVGADAYDVIINATSSSLFGELPDVPPNAVAPGTFCYDMTYGHGETEFLKWARRQGTTRLCSGLGMLVEQASEAFLLWRGVRPTTAPVLAELRARGLY
jgi:shikimate dehydrogenase